MKDFSKRSTEIEIMDHYKGSKESLQAILNDINRVNRLLGGYAITLNAVFQLIAEKRKESYTILDMGCAEGTMLRKLALAARKRKIKVQLIGVDLNAQSLELARRNSVEFPEIRYMQRDILSAEFLPAQFDIVMTTLTLHHFNDMEIVRFLKRFVSLASIGVVINDLQRNPLAYYLFKVFGLFFIKTEIAQKDGLLSILRAFKRRELMGYAHQVDGADHYIKWKWAFRYLWILKKK
ncbi:methyltransferase domain-containing protein [Maribacter confluentis]|uniref:Methyltransferase domain-containing protein n=1 Tax=Maribacter confluentis TaxID=1656093 RepID=A0ABT8RJD2_9FLAO|nr:methyltransferase domain-containing protein [Maribacter confluentis]MDO1511160.1 methyltransferase domain-containing protein [Maribacter confluentis]